MRLILLVFALLLNGCESQDSSGFLEVGLKMKSVDNISDKLAFRCRYESVPESGAGPDILFNYARWLQKNNLLKRQQSINAEVERLYRVSAENGAFKASINLQNGAMRGHFQLRDHEYLRLSQALIDAGVATGYYFIGIFLQQGSAGLKQDDDMARRYFRKSADEGNANAQIYVGDLLAPIEIAPVVAKEMWRCAAQQGNGDAAKRLGVDLKIDGFYQEALEAFQLGVAAGNSGSASFLKHGFLGPDPDEKLYYLGQEKDLERSERYQKIGAMLAGYSYANPAVPEINEIVPLPPAKLPPWDGKLRWVEEREANIPPPKPSEELIQQLAKDKGLDPATGKPMPGSPAFSAYEFPLERCRSGESCPVEGYWKVMWPEYTENTEEICHFNEGDLMPPRRCDYRFKRFWPLPDEVIQHDQVVNWGLMG